MAVAGLLTKCEFILLIVKIFIYHNPEPGAAAAHLRRLRRTAPLVGYRACGCAFVWTIGNETKTVAGSWTLLASFCCPKGTKSNFAAAVAQIKMESDG